MTACGSPGGPRSQEWKADDLRFMRAALQQAYKALEENEVPIGCVIVRDGAIVAAGSNKTNETRNGTRHAEFVAIDAMLQQAGGDVAAARFTDCHLYVTCEPCIMCAGALSLLRFASVTYGCPNDKFGGNGSIFSVHTMACGSCSGGDASASPASRQDGQHLLERSPLQQQQQQSCQQPQQLEQSCQAPALTWHQDQPQESTADGRNSSSSGADGRHINISSAGLPTGASRQPGSPYPSRGGLLAAEAVDLLQRFYAAGNPSAPVPHRPVRERPSAPAAAAAMQLG